MTCRTMNNQNQPAMKVLSITIGVIIGVLLIVMGFRIVQNLFTRAEDIAPRDVVTGEITQNSAKIVWSTGEESQGVVKYGTSPTALNFFAPEMQKTKTHSVDLTLLSPGTTYYFQIRIGEKDYDNGGVPWTLATKNIERQTIVPTVPPLPTQAQTAPDVNTTSCNETDCDKIKEKLGQGCSTRDYVLCLKKGQ